MTPELFVTQDVGKEFDPDDTSRMTEPIVNGFIAYCIEAWKILKYRDDDMWMTYQKDFQGWSEDTFKIANVNTIRALRNFLRENGVFVNKAKTVNMIKSLLQTLEEENQHIWTQQELQYQWVRGPLNSRHMSQSTIRQETKTEFPLPGVTMLHQNDDTKYGHDKPFLQSNFTQPYIPQQTVSRQPYSRNIF